jgi:hypothetical protein
MQMSVPVKDLLGWIAALLTVVTFAQRSMIPLRVTAILANVFFIAYGAIGHFLPVLTLHVVLLPVNSTRLAVHLRRRAEIPFLVKWFTRPAGRAGVTRDS